MAFVPRSGRSRLVDVRGIDGGFPFHGEVRTEPARLFGLHPRKGAIAVDSDADLVVWDPTAVVTLRADDLHQRVDYCPYEGWEVRGYPRDVISRGRVILRERRFVGERGWGHFLAR